MLTLSRACNFPPGLPSRAQDSAPETSLFRLELSNRLATAGANHTVNRARVIVASGKF
jgi:hypothetical protein